MTRCQRIIQILGSAAIGAVIGCNSNSTSDLREGAEPGSKAAASFPPKELPKGVKVGRGNAQVQ